MALLLAGLVAVRPLPAQAGASPKALTQRPGVSKAKVVSMVNAKDQTVLVRVPGGAFSMGDADQSDNPPHQVVVPSFWIARTPVTNAQYRAFVKATHHVSAGDWESFAAHWGEQVPVVHVSWHDANAYCHWAGLRLPTEQEMEKAARGTDGRKYPWGREWSTQYCPNGVGRSTLPRSPGTVGSFPAGASPYGCLDMAGSVWQWTASWLEGDSGYRVVRGGAFNCIDVHDFRCSQRYRKHPWQGEFNVGFRCAK